MQLENTFKTQQSHTTKNDKNTFKTLQHNISSQFLSFIPFQCQGFQSQSNNIQEVSSQQLSSFKQRHDIIYQDEQSNLIDHGKLEYTPKRRKNWGSIKLIISRQCNNKQNKNHSKVKQKHQNKLKKQGYQGSSQFIKHDQIKKKKKIKSKKQKENNLVQKILKIQKIKFKLQKLVNDIPGYLCQYCLSIFCKKATLVKHKFFCKKIVQNQMDIQQNQNKSEIFNCIKIVPIEKLHKCSYCDKKFDDGRKLGGHVSKVHLQQSKKNKIQKQKINLLSTKRQINSSQLQEQYVYQSQIDELKQITKQDMLLSSFDKKSNNNLRNLFTNKHLI